MTMPDKMKCLTLWEPWATAMARGYKMVETRSWYTRYRGPLVIHAAKNRTVISDNDWVEGILFEGGLLKEENIGKYEFSFKHLGCLLAVTHLLACVPTESIRSILPDEEQALGNYESGRFAWICMNTRKLAEPIPFRGQQGLFDLPTDMVALVNSRVDKAPQCPAPPLV